MYRLRDVTRAQLGMHALCGSGDCKSQRSMGVRRHVSARSLDMIRMLKEQEFRDLRKFVARHFPPHAELLERLL